MQYRPGEVADILGVSVDTVRRWVDDGEIAAMRTPSGQRRIDGADLARWLRDSATDDVPAWAGRHSARNRFPGIVTEVRRDGAGVVAAVEIQAGPFRLVSLVTAEAVDDLGLAPGSLVVAAAKSTNVTIEAGPR